MIPTHKDIDSLSHFEIGFVLSNSIGLLRLEELLMSALKKPAALVKTPRTSLGLCDALFDEFDLLRNDLSDIHRASAVAKLAIQIIATKRLEIDAAQLIKGGLTVRPVVFEKRGIALGS
jgi:hypothetical protein